MFCFTIRDVLWLTVVVGLGVALWADRGAASLYRGRSQAAYNALNAADYQPEWHDDQLLIHPRKANGERMEVMFYGLKKPDGK